MDDQSRSAWTHINPNIRSRIVKSLTSQNQSPTHNNNAFPKKAINNNSINLHKISLHDLLSNFHVSNNTEQTVTDDTIATTEVETRSTTNDKTTIQDNDQLLIQAVKSSVNNVAKSNHLSADIRNILSKITQDLHLLHDFDILIAVICI